MVVVAAQPKSKLMGGENRKWRVNEFPRVHAVVSYVSIGSNCSHEVDNRLYIIYFVYRWGLDSRRRWIGVNNNRPIQKGYRRVKKDTIDDIILWIKCIHIIMLCTHFVHAIYYFMQVKCHLSEDGDRSLFLLLVDAFNP